jgi:solute:Na+ symporter, SSS family
VALSGVDYFVVLLYLGGILMMGFYFKRFVHSSEDYFLAGKMLPFWAIGMSIVVSDIGALDFVGLSGQAYRFGIVVGNFDWIGSVPAMVLAAMVFIPYYWRAGIYTIPEYLGRRYNVYVRTVHASVWLIFIVFSLGVTLYASGVLLSELMGWTITTSVFITAIIVGVYTITGGLSAVVMTDVIQFTIMFIGAIAILVIGFGELGGWQPMVDRIQALGPEYNDHFSLIISPEKDTPYPWTGILFGLALVMAPSYFIANQTVVQRCLGARNEWHAKASMLGAAFFKMFIPAIMVVPGLIALALYPDIADGDRAFPLLVKELLPKGLTGLLFAAFFAGLMSSVDSMLNSSATIWTKDLYERFIHPNANDKHLLVMGRIFTAVILVLGVLTAPISSKFPGLYVYIQTLLSFFQGPTLGVLVLGIFWVRTTAWGGLVGLVGGMLISAFLFAFKGSFFTIQDPFLYISWWSFLGSVILGIVTSLFGSQEPLQKLRGLVFGLVLQDDELQDAIHNRLEDNED